MSQEGNQGINNSREKIQRLKQQRLNTLKLWQMHLHSLSVTEKARPVEPWGERAKE